MLIIGTSRLSFDSASTITETDLVIFASELSCPRSNLYVLTVSSCRVSFPFNAFEPFQSPLASHTEVADEVQVRVTESFTVILLADM